MYVETERYMDLATEVLDRGLPDVGSEKSMASQLEKVCEDAGEWIALAARALAQCVVSGTAFLDVEAVVMDGAIAPDLLRALCEQTRAALDAYDWEGLHRPRLELGGIGSDARALGGALLPLHACFAPDHDTFLKG